MRTDISVVIPVYNVEQYIAECLDSVIRQSHESIEIICVDDLGTDGSMRIVEEYARRDDRIKIIHHDVNRGLGVARNTGMEHAIGKYVFFLDSDDCITGDTLGKLIETAKMTLSDVVVSRTKTVLEDDTDECLIERQRAVDNYLNFSPCERYICDNIVKSLSKLSSVVWGKLYSLDFLKSNVIRFAEANIIHEDDGFNLKLLSNKPIVTWVDDVGVLYRLRKNSITGKIERADQRKKKLRNLRLSLEDAFKYANKRLSCKDAACFVQDVKSCDLYHYCFEKKFNIGGIARVTWSPRSRQIKLLGVRVFSKIRPSKITIIVPFYNTIKNLGTEQYLRQNVTSLISQDYGGDYEVIYVDNNSSDESRDLIESHNDPRIRIISEHTPGVANARNAGIESARGDYIAFVDSDDFVGENYLCTAAKNLENSPDILIGGFTMCFGENTSIETLRYQAIRKFGKKVKNVYASMECSSNIYFKTSLINGCRIRYAGDISIGEDNLFNISAILQAGSVRFFDYHDYFYQCLGNSSSNVKSDKYITFIDAYDRAFALAKKKFGFINKNAVWYFNRKWKDFENLMEHPEIFAQTARAMLKKHGVQSTL